MICIGKTKCTSEKGLLACFCRLFFYLQLSSFFHCAVLFVACEEIIRCLVFELLFRYVFSLLFSSVFSNVNRDSQIVEVLLFSVSFCPPKSIINSFFACSIFSASVARQRRHLISCFLKPGFHMSGKSQTVWDFTVSRASQILPTNENSKS